MSFLGNLTTFSVKYFDKTDDFATSLDVTRNVKGVPQFTDTGSGEINAMEMIIDADFSNGINSNTVFDAHDRFNVKGTDIAGNDYERMFEIDDMLPSKAKGEGSLITMKCLGIEYHVQNIHCTRQFWFKPPDYVMQKLGDQYNLNRSANVQPGMQNHDGNYNATTELGNGLPNFSIGNYEYGLNEDKTYNRMMDVLDTMLQAVDDQGTLQPFELGFDTTVPGLIQMRAFESGIGPMTGTVTVSDAVTTTISQMEGLVSNPEGTQTYAWGEPNSGSLPMGHSIYRSHVFRFLYRPLWSLSTDYPTSSTVFLSSADASAFAGTHWRSLKTAPAGTTPSTSDTTWDRITMASEFGNTDSVDPQQYSPWTIDKSALWAISGGAATLLVASASIGDANGFEGGGAGFPDQNIIINTPDFFRTWTHSRVSSTTGLSGLYAYDDGSFPVGFRILVIDRGIFGAGAVDRYGREFTNCVAEFTEVRGGGADSFYEWVVKYQGIDATNRFQVANFDELAVYEYRASDATFNDISGDDLANDCFHKYTSISNVSALDITDYRPYQTSPSLFPEITTSTVPWTGNQNSAVEVEYTFGAITDRATSPSLYLARGAWICIGAPFPRSTHLGIAEGVGDLYGGGTKGSGQSINQPSKFDFSNMTFSFDGDTGFNHGSVETMGPIKGIHFQVSVIMTGADWLQFLFGNSLGGTVQIRCLAIDSADNQVFQDFEVENTDGTGQPVDLLTSGFSGIKSHRPRWAELTSLNVAGFITPKQQDVQNVFEWRNVQFIMWQLLNVYDEHGRYNPEGNLDKLDQTTIQLAGGTIRLRIDDFDFIKPLLVTSGSLSGSNENIEPDFISKPNIILYHQLKATARAENEKFKFPHKEFNITTEGHSIFDIKFGNKFFFKDAELVNDNDNGSSFTVELIAKKIEYSFTNSGAGPGGIRRTITGVKRFV